MYAIIGDNSTVAWISSEIEANCSALIIANETMSTVSNDTLYPPIYPELALQWYRESSFGLLQFIQNVSNASSVATYYPSNSSTLNNTSPPLIYPQT